MCCHILSKMSRILGDPSQGSASTKSDIEFDEQDTKSMTIDENPSEIADVPFPLETIEDDAKPLDVSQPTENENETQSWHWEHQWVTIPRFAKISSFKTQHVVPLSRPLSS